MPSFSLVKTTYLSSRCVGIAKTHPLCRFLFNPSCIYFIKLEVALFLSVTTNSFLFLSTCLLSNPVVSVSVLVHILCRNESDLWARTLLFMSAVLAPKIASAVQVFDKRSLTESVRLFYTLFWVSPGFYSGCFWLD